MKLRGGGTGFSTAAGAGAFDLSDSIADLAGVAVGVAFLAGGCAGLEAGAVASGVGAASCAADAGVGVAVSGGAGLGADEISFDRDRQPACQATPPAITSTAIK